MTNYKKLCKKCFDELKDYKIIRHNLGTCERCGKTGGIAECEYKPEIIQDINALFGNLNKPKC